MIAMVPGELVVVRCMSLVRSETADGSSYVSYTQHDEVGFLLSTTSTWHDDAYDEDVVSNLVLFSSDCHVYYVPTDRIVTLDECFNRPLWPRAVAPE